MEVSSRATTLVVVTGNQEGVWWQTHLYMAFLSSLISSRYDSLRRVGLLILQLRAPRASIPRELQGNSMVFSDSASEAVW